MAMINSPKKKNKLSITPQKTDFRSSLGKLFRKSLLILNITTIIPILIADLAWFIPPNDFWLPSFLSLMTPWLFIPPFFWMIFWSFSYFPYAILNLGVLLMNFQFFFNTFQFHLSSKPSAKAISLVSFNAAAFYYQPTIIEEVAQEIKKFEPDILCIQEFLNYPAKDYENAIECFKDKLNFSHHAFIELLPKSKFGMIIFSKFPIKKFSQVSESKQKNGIMYADIETYGKIIRVYNMHLQSYNIDDTMKSEIQNFGDAWAVAKKLRTTWVQQDLQLQRYELSLKENKKPVIVCADLNNPPYNTFYKRAKRDFQDTFLAAGWGLGHTHGKGLFSFRIDYIFASFHFEVERHSIFYSKHSDHYLLHTYLSFDEIIKK